MKDEIFKVNFIHRKNCFLYFPERWHLSLPNNMSNSVLCLKMKYGTNKLAYFSANVQPYNSSDDLSIGINATYAHLLGLQDNEEVFISSISHCASIRKVNVGLLSSDDWDIMESAMNTLQSSLLDQIRVVWPGQTFVVWISKNLHFSLRIDSLDPSNEVGMLQTFTDLVLLPPTDQLLPVLPEKNQPLEPLNDRSYSNQSDDICETLKMQDPSFWELIKKVLSLVLPIETNKSAIKQENKTLSTLQKYKWKSKSAPYRIHPLKSVGRSVSAADCLLHQPCNVFVHRTNLPVDYVYSNSSIEIVVCKLTKVALSIDSKVEENSETNVEGEAHFHTRRPLSSVYARLIVIEDIVTDLSQDVKASFIKQASYSEHHCILLPEALKHALKIKTGARVQLSLETYQKDNAAKIELIPVGKWTNETIIAPLFNEYLITSTKNTDLFLSSGINISLKTMDSSPNVFVNLETNYIHLDSNASESCTLEVNEIKKYNKELHNLIDDDIKDEEMFWGIGTYPLVEEGFTTLQMSLCLQPSGGKSILPSNILVVGASGSGKTALGHQLCAKVKCLPNYVHCLKIQCKHLKGKTAETIQKYLGQWMAECVHYQPSILYLDDIDAIVGIGSNPEEHSAEDAHSFRVGEMLAETIVLVQQLNYLVVIATAPSLCKLSPSVAAPRGQHFFKMILNIPDLTKDDRLATMKAIVSEKAGVSTVELDSLDFASHIAKAEGYVVQDIADMVDKAIFAGWKRTLARKQREMVLEDCDLEEGIMNTTPLSLQGVTLFKDTAQCWADVGGLTEVKRVLVEALQWPSQYMELFAKCPLRYQSGLLLYGAPGTGKTLLAGAVAHECGLNFISVKGPELLSKYIGASEEAVRNIFVKAQSARPCILFFDEFDSLAPRRGHDSTGVTDRVVNQLLTQLDGVESLVGVWVVAATSRPDLLDPALLRPGRLDRAVLCPLPDDGDRLDILKAQSRRMKLASDVDLKAIADQTEGFTGADLQAVLYTAQLSAVETACQKTFSEPANENVETGAKVLVNQDQLLAALSDTRPSLPVDEKTRFRMIYDKFIGSRCGNRKASEVQPQRATLA